VPEGLSLAELEREIIEVAIRRCNDNIPEAANLLRVSPSTLYRKRAAWAQD
jgi:DNA-binding NtrC family response regulator